MPSSISVVHWVTVPSSSMFSDPRRPARVPSSTMVTPGAATRWPMRPEYTEVPLRLKSPSRPWPTASCSSTPGQPGPSTTGIDAGGRIDRLQVHQRLAQRFARSRLRLAAGEQFLVRVASAAAGVARFAAAVFLDEDLHVEAHQRAHVGGEHAVAARDQHRVHRAGQAHHHLRARAGRRRAATHRLRAAPPPCSSGAMPSIGSCGRIQLAAARPRRAGPRDCASAVAADRARGARRLQQRLAADVVGIGEAGLLAADRAHADALLDRVRAVLDDAVLDRPALAPAVLEIQVAEIHARAHQPREGAVEFAQSPGRSGASRRVCASSQCLIIRLMVSSDQHAGEPGRSALGDLRPRWRRPLRRGPFSTP